MAQLKRMAIPRQQPSGSANEASDEMEACTIPSPAVDYGMGSNEKEPHMRLVTDIICTLAI